MSGIAFVFIPNGFFTQPTPDFLRQSSFVQPTSTHIHVPPIPKLSRTCRPHLPPSMRRHRAQRISSHPALLKSLENLQKSTTSIWQNANSAERLIICSAGAAAVAVASIVVNALFHISIMLAFSIVPLLLVPILLTFVASLTAFAFLAFATAGAGFFFVGTPFFALALVAKALLPVILIVGGTLFLISRLLGFQRNKPEESLEVFEEIDDFERFDQALRNRQSPKSNDITRWTIMDVIDELDYTGLSGYRQLFLEERIDGPALLELTYDDIRTEFGKSMPLGDRMRLIRLVSVLRRRSSKLQ